MDFAKWGLLVNAFFYLHCNYFQLVWMCHNLTNNNKVNRLHERCLHLIYNDKNSSCEDLLEKGRSASIHLKKLRTFAVEFFKIFKGLSPVIFAKAFAVRQQGQYNGYGLCQNGQPWIRRFVIHKFKLVGQYTISYERDKLYIN